MNKKRDGVADGARTHDNRNHNPGLYQLSYSHREERIIAAATAYSVAGAASFEGRWTFICTLKRYLRVL